MVTPEAEEGTFAHAVAAYCIKTGCNCCAGMTVQYEDHGKEIKRSVLDDMVEPVQRYIDFIRSLSKCPAASCESHAFTFIEQQVSLSSLYNVPDHYGYVDFFIYYPESKTLHLLDLKYGKGVEIEVRDNSQMIIYGWAGIHFIELFGYEIDKIILSIFQPRIHDKPRYISYSRSEFDALLPQIEVDAQLAWHAYGLDSIPENEPELFNPGAEQCRFCPAGRRGHCVAMETYLENKLQCEFHDETSIRDARNKIRKFTDERLAEIYPCLELLDLLLGDLRKETYNRMKAGKTIQGYKLVEGRKGNRKWIDEKEAERLLLKQFKLPVDEIYKKQLSSPTQIEAYLKRVKSERRLEKIKPLIDRKDGAPIIVPVSDPRSEIVLQLQDTDFENLSTKKE